MHLVNSDHAVGHGVDQRTKWEYKAYTQANPPDSSIPARIEIERLEGKVPRQRAYLAAQEEIGRRRGLNTTVYSASGSPGEYWGQPTTIGLGSKEIGDVKANMVFDFPLSRYFLHSERTQKPSEELENSRNSWEFVPSLPSSLSQTKVLIV